MILVEGGLASLSSMADLWYPCLFTTGCNDDSHSKSWTIVLSRLHSRSLMLSCWALINPPRWQLRACVRLKVDPRVHFDGIFLICFLYRMANASWNSPLVRLNPCDANGRAPSQPEAPGLESCSIMCCIFGCCDALICSFLSFYFVLSSEMASDLAFETSSAIGSLSDCLTICLVSGTVTFVETW